MKPFGQKATDSKAAGFPKSSPKNRSDYDARRYPFVDSDCDDRDLRIRSRSGLEYCALLSRYGEHRFVGKAGRDHQQWTAAPDVASAALQAELREKINTSDPKAANSRREALSSILSIKPLSSVDWLSLSGMQLVTDQPMEQVLESLKLSMLTGPNEGYLMAERGIFGVSLWESLSPDLKRRVAIDLAAGEISGNEKIRAVLSAEPERVRNELREALLATGLSPKEIEQRLGF